MKPLVAHSSGSCRKTVSPAVPRGTLSRRLAVKLFLSWNLFLLHCFWPCLIAAAAMARRLLTCWCLSVIACRSGAAERSLTPEVRLTDLSLTEALCTDCSLTALLPSVLFFLGVLSLLAVALLAGVSLTDGSSITTCLVGLPLSLAELLGARNSGCLSSAWACCLSSLLSMPLCIRACVRSAERFPLLFFFGGILSKAGLTAQ